MVAAKPPTKTEQDEDEAAFTAFTGGTLYVTAMLPDGCVHISLCMLRRKRVMVVENTLHLYV